MNDRLDAHAVQVGRKLCGVTGQVLEVSVDAICAGSFLTVQDHVKLVDPTMRSRASNVDAWHCIL